MILVHCGLDIVFQQRDKHVTRVIPGLQADFTLQCLLCGKTHPLTTPTTYPLKADSTPFSYIHPIVTVIQQTRSCDNCGMISTLPKADREGLKKTLEKTITQDFILQHSQDQAPFLAQRLFDRLVSISS